jgi:Pyridoxamine 5'-phosphate oxidase
MVAPQPISAESMIQATDPGVEWIEGTDPTEWSYVVDALEGTRATHWVATLRPPGGAPHVMPVLGVWVDGGLFFSAGARTRKARNLAADARCVVTTELEAFDLVVEGRAEIVRAETTLRAVADACDSTYGWRVTVRDGAFHDAAGAPTAGPPPYDVYAVLPSVAFVFPLEDAVVPTRWRFAPPGASESE